MEVGGSAGAVEVECAVGTPRDAFKQAGVRGKVAAAQVDGALWDMSTRLLPGSRVKPLFSNYTTPDVQAAMAHSAAHVLGAALEAICPGILLTNGPGNPDGRFYYEGCVGRCASTCQTISADEMKSLRSHMRGIIKRDHPFERVEVTEAEARDVFVDNPFKQHYISQAMKRVPGGPISLFRCGPFIDLCRGPHVASTGLLGGVALLSANGHAWDPAALQTAGWPESEPADMQRVHGVALQSMDALKEWQQHQKTMAKRSHRTIGAAQELFMIHPVSPGSPFFLPHGYVRVVRGPLLLGVPIHGCCRCVWASVLTLSLTGL